MKHVYPSLFRSGSCRCAPVCSGRVFFAQIYINGMSIVDLMLALVLGIIVAGAAMATFLVATKLAGSQRGTAAISTGGQSLITHLGQQIRMAGLVDILESEGQWALINSGAVSTGSMLATVHAGTMPGLYALHGCNGGYAHPATLLDYACSSANGNLSSSFTVAYQALSSPPGNVGNWMGASLPTSFDPKMGLNFDCGGLSPLSDNTNADPAGEVIINRYYLEPTGSRRLLCSGNGNPDQPVQIATGVEQFQLLYGVGQTSMADQYTAVASYVDASAVNSMLNGWPNVIAVQLCMVISGEVGSADPNSGTNVFNLDCAGQPIVISDGRLRRAHRFVVNVRNNVTTAVVMP